MTKESIEAMLTRIVDEFDKTYFNGAGLVIGVKFCRFFWDWRNLKRGIVGVTFGMYDTSTRLIYLNAYFHKPLMYGMYLREVKAILWHELVHGALAQSLTPVRFGMFDGRCGGHGPEFEALESKYPEHLTSEEMDRMAPSVLQWMKTNVPKTLREGK